MNKTYRYSVYELVMRYIGEYAQYLIDSYTFACSDVRGDNQWKES